MADCPCGSRKAYEACCRPLIQGERRADTAEQLMRARYSAYVVKEIDFIRTSLHPDHRADYDEKSTRAWADQAEWQELRIIDATGGPDDQRGTVEFVATFAERGVRQEHHERSMFLKKDGIWYFESGKVLPPRQVVRTAPKAGRNDPCPCGSGRKFKKCCGA